MRGRFTQYQAQIRYLERFNWQALLAFKLRDQRLNGDVLVHRVENRPLPGSRERRV